MHKPMKLYFNIFFGGLLVFLFTVPGAYLNAACDAIGQKAANASALLWEGGDLGEVSAALSDMERIFERRAPVLRLFLTHGEVDALGAAIAVCAPLTERQALLSGLNAVLLSAEHLRGIEKMDWHTVF